MPFVIEDFDMERYVHVDALVANFQGVFLNTVRLAELQNGIKKGQERWWIFLLVKSNDTLFLGAFD